MAFLYLNRGLILEQAICSLVKQYFDDLKLQDTYKNFNVAVTTEHPFARMYLDSNLQASDTFPCVVVSTQEDTKPQDFMELAPHIQGVELNKDDINIILNTKDKGTQKEIAGLCTVTNEQNIKALYGTIQKKGVCRGFSCRIRRKDTLGLEVWAENVQLKNEIYEQLRLFVGGMLRHLLEKIYPFFDIALFDDTITGHRSNNYNMDFDTVLSGAHIAFEINYCIEQIVIDTELESINENVILEVINNVYKEKNTKRHYTRGNTTKTS